MRPRPLLPQGPFLVVGLARSGTAAALALARRGERVIGVDAAPIEPPLELAGAPVELHAGDDGLGLLARAAAVIKSPGVPRQAPVIATARERGVPVLGELELGWRLVENEFVAVTGTNGKTTTVELIAHIHRQAGAEVVVAGNVGTALSGLAGELEVAATVVCEVSSFQLEDAEHFAPEAAVLVNLGTDHLDRHGSIEDYVRAKVSMFARQHSEDVAVLPGPLLAGPASRGTLRAGGALPQPFAGAARRVSFGSDAQDSLRERDGGLWWLGRPLLAAGELRMRGRHNLENAMAAAAVCLARGLEQEAVAAALRSFAGVRHRLEEIATRGGVRFINDSKATNIASTLVALEALAGAPGVHLILGGQGKGQDFAALRDAVRARCSGAYLIGEDAAVIARALTGAGVPVQVYGDLERALASATRAAAAGEVVLLSPAGASFDQFSDFEARGERFRQLVCG